MKDYTDRLLTEIKAIESCGECPYIYYFIDIPRSCCKKARLTITSGVSIPKNCPMRGKTLKWPEVK